MSCGALYCRQLLRDEADLFGRSGDLTASTLARMLSTHGLDIFLQMDSETRKGLGYEISPFTWVQGFFRTTLFRLGSRVSD